MDLRTHALGTKEEKELDKEIHLLEEKLGLYGRNNKVLHYDPLYFRNNLGDRKDYCKDLKKKLEKGYVSPPIIIAITYAPPIHSFIPSNTIYDVVLLVHKDYYYIPKESERADTYFGQGKSNVHKKVNCLNRNIDISMHRQGLSVVITKIII